MQDSSGTIENEELAGFLKDLLSLAKKVIYKNLLFFKDEHANFACFSSHKLVLAHLKVMKSLKMI